MVTLFTDFKKTGVVAQRVRDALRHSFSTYSHAIVADMHEPARRMNNSIAVLERHYIDTAAQKAGVQACFALLEDFVCFLSLPEMGASAPTEEDAVTSAKIFQPDGRGANAPSGPRCYDFAVSNFSLKTRLADWTAPAPVAAQVISRVGHGELKARHDGLKQRVMAQAKQWVTVEQLILKLPRGLQSRKCLRGLVALGIVPLGSTPLTGRPLYDLRAALTKVDQMIVKAVSVPTEISRLRTKHMKAAGLTARESILTLL